MTLTVVIAAGEDAVAATYVPSAASDRPSMLPTAVPFCGTPPPSCSADTLADAPRSTLIDWPTCAPPGKLFTPAEPSSKFVPLYVVCDEIRLISLIRCFTSD